MDIFIIRDGQQTGPFNENTVQSLLRDGGLRAKDMAWRKGLPSWVPVGELLNPGSEKPSEPPAIQESAAQKAPVQPASAKQKAFLKYLGATMENDITRDEAALAISDALEKPKLQTRLAKWHEEKLRLHPEVFQDEIDFRRANRVTRYLELCQTEASDAVKDVTKAHVQVLVESLDKKHSNWETDSRDPLWNQLLPAVAEHFPQLVKDEWKGKLKAGEKSIVAASIAKTSGVLTPAPASSGPVAAAVRGIMYGVGVLALVIGGHYLYKNSQSPDATDPVAAVKSEAPKVEPPPMPPAVPAEPAAPLAENAPAAPQEAPLIGATEPASGVPAPAEPEEKPASALAAMKEDVAVAEVKPAPAPMKPAAPGFSPAPIPGEVPPEAPATPAAPAANAPVAPKAVATLKQGIGVTLSNGRVTLPVGTKLRILGYEGQNVRVAWNNNIFNVPLAATDVSEAVALAAPPPVAPPPATAPGAPPAAPMAPGSPSNPLSDL